MDNKKFNLIITDQMYLDLHQALTSAHTNTLLDLADGKISSRKANHLIWDDVRGLLSCMLRKPKRKYKKKAK